MVILNWIPKIKITHKSILLIPHFRAANDYSFWSDFCKTYQKMFIYCVFIHVYCLRWVWLVSCCFLIEVFPTVTILFPKTHHIEVTYFWNIISVQNIEHQLCVTYNANGMKVVTTSRVYLDFVLALMIWVSKMNIAFFSVKSSGEFMAQWLMEEDGELELTKNCVSCVVRMTLWNSAIWAGWDGQDMS